ncbi:MAG TPA: hypothetical protein VMI10_14430 [Terriglobales bacterium]|nr:hypothetical protein [Terriglobales bacterium]
MTKKPIILAAAKVQGGAVLRVRLLREGRAKHAATAIYACAAGDDSFALLNHSVQTVYRDCDLTLRA